MAGFNVPRAGDGYLPKAGQLSQNIVAILNIIPLMLQFQTHIASEVKGHATGLENEGIELNPNTLAEQRNLVR